MPHNSITLQLVEYKSFILKNSGTGRSPAFAPGTPPHFFQLCPDGAPGPDPPPGLVATHEQAGPLAPPLLPPVFPEPEPDPPGGPAVGVGLGGGLGVAAGAAKYCYKFCANKEGWIMKKSEQ